MRELQRMLAMGMGGSLSWQISSGEITYLMQGQMSTKFGTRIAMEMKSMEKQSAFPMFAQLNCGFHLNFHTNTPT